MKLSYKRLRVVMKDGGIVVIDQIHVDAMLLHQRKRHTELQTKTN